MLIKKRSLGSGRNPIHISHLAEPKSKNKDLARREFILNILLLGSLILSFMSTLSASIGLISASPNVRMYYLPTYITVLTVFALFLFSYYLSRTGKSRLAAYIFIALYMLFSSYLGLKWGANVPMGLLVYSLLIVMSGILISSRFAFFIASVITVIFSLLINLQKTGVLIVDSTLKNRPTNLRDGIVYSVTLFLIAIVSWLFNREMEKSHKRARSSETALRRQRDRLEQTVAKRTRELKQAQAEKLLQMYRFAEVGKMSFGLFHDLTNLLTLVSLNLNRLRKISKNMPHLEDMHESLEQAMLANKRQEQFVKAVLNQLQNRDTVRTFSLNQGIEQALQVLSYKAKRQRVRILFPPAPAIRTVGNPTAFTQVITNLLANAIDSYDSLRKKERLVEIEMRRGRGQVVIAVRDWGSGIDPKAQPRIFDLLFTTKGAENGTGIGLAICKNVIQKDFGGSITVASEQGKGSTFTVTFPLSSAWTKPFVKQAS